MGKWDPSKPNAGRRGARWIACREKVLRRDNYVCHICGHQGAGEADHYPLPIAALRARGWDPDDPQHSKAAHGTSSPCPVCGRKCNQSRGRRLVPSNGHKPVVQQVGEYCAYPCPEPWPHQHRYPTREW